MGPFHSLPISLSWTTPSANPRLKDPSVRNPGHSESVGLRGVGMVADTRPRPTNRGSVGLSPKNAYCSDGKTNTVAIEKRILSYPRSRVGTDRSMGVFKENVQTCPYSVPEGWVRHPFSLVQRFEFSRPLVDTYLAWFRVSQN